MPVTENGAALSTLTLWRGGWSGNWYGRPFTFLHTTHLLRIVLRTWRRKAGIQNFCRMAVRVAVTPECSYFLWKSSMINFVRVCFEGSRYGNLAFSSRGGVLWSLPPLRRRPSLSINSFNCLTIGGWERPSVILSCSCWKHSCWQLAI